MRYSGHMYTGLVLACLLENEMQAHNHMPKIKRLLSSISIPEKFKNIISTAVNDYERKKNKDILKSIDFLNNSLNSFIDEVKKFKDLDAPDRENIAHALEKDKNFILEIFKNDQTPEEKLAQIKMFIKTFNKRDELYSAVYGPLNQWRKIAFSRSGGEIETSIKKEVKKEVLFSFLRRLLLNIINEKLAPIQGIHSLDDETKAERRKLQQDKKDINSDKDISFLLSEAPFSEGDIDTTIRLKSEVSADPNNEHFNAYSKVTAFALIEKQRKYRQTDIHILEECEQSPEEEFRNAAILIKENYLKITDLKNNDYLLNCYRNKTPIDKEYVPSYIISDDMPEQSSGNHEYHEYRSLIKSRFISEELSKLAGGSEYGNNVPYFLLGCVAPDIFHTQRDGHHVYGAPEYIAEQAKKDQGSDRINNSSHETIKRQIYALLVRAVVYARNNDKRNAWFAFGVIVHFAFDALVASATSVSDRIRYTTKLKNVVLRAMGDYYNKDGSAEIAIPEEEDTGEKTIEGEISVDGIFNSNEYSEVLRTDIKDTENQHFVFDDYSKKFHDTADSIMEDLVKQRRDTILNNINRPADHTYELSDIDHYYNKIKEKFGSLNIDNKNAFHIYNNHKIILRNRDNEEVRFGIYRSLNEGSGYISPDSDPIIETFYCLCRIGIYIKNNFANSATKDTDHIYNEIHKESEGKSITAIFKDIYISREPDEIYEFYEGVAESFSEFEEHDASSTSDLHAQNESIWDKIRRKLFFWNDYRLTENEIQEISRESFIPYIELTLGRRHLSNIFSSKYRDLEKLDEQLEYTFKHLKKSYDLDYPDGMFALADFFLKLKSAELGNKKRNKNFREKIGKFLNDGEHSEFNNYAKLHGILSNLAYLDPESPVKCTSSAIKHPGSIKKLCNLYINPPEDAKGIFQPDDNDKLSVIAQYFENAINNIGTKNKNKYKFRLVLAKIYDSLNRKDDAIELYGCITNSDSGYSFEAYYKIIEYAIQNIEQVKGNLTFTQFDTTLLNLVHETTSYFKKLLQLAQNPDKIKTLPRIDTLQHITADDITKISINYIELLRQLLINIRKVMQNGAEHMNKELVNKLLEMIHEGLSLQWLSLDSYVSSHSPKFDFTELLTTLDNTKAHYEHICWLRTIAHITHKINNLRHLATNYTRNSSIKKIHTIIHTIIKEHKAKINDEIATTNDNLKTTHRLLRQANIALDCKFAEFHLIYADSLNGTGQHDAISEYEKIKKDIESLILRCNTDDPFNSSHELKRIQTMLSLRLGSQNINTVRIELQPTPTSNSSKIWRPFSDMVFAIDDFIKNGDFQSVYRSLENLKKSFCHDRIANASFSYFYTQFIYYNNCSNDLNQFQENVRCCIQDNNFTNALAELYYIINAIQSFIIYTKLNYDSANNDTVSHQCLRKVISYYIRNFEREQLHSESQIVDIWDSVFNNLESEYNNALSYVNSHDHKKANASLKNLQRKVSRYTKITLELRDYPVVYCFFPNDHINLKGQRFIIQKKLESFSFKIETALSRNQQSESTQKSWFKFY